VISLTFLGFTGDRRDPKITLKEKVRERAASDEILPFNDGTTPNIEKSTWKYVVVVNTKQLLEIYVDQTTKSKTEIIKSHKQITQRITASRRLICESNQPEEIEKLKQILDELMA